MLYRMKKLKELVKSYHIQTLNNNSYPFLNKIKTAYKNKNNIPHYSFVYRGKMTADIGAIIADFYEEQEDNPSDVLVSTAYGQLCKEIVQQYHFIQEHLNIDFEPYNGKGEPYRDSLEMVRDVYNQHMYFFTTTNGFGEKTVNRNNPMLQKTGIVTHGYELLMNDIFRIVHDVFGHATYGYSFGPRGEDMAWITHTTMFTPLARAAITTETRGQNCWVNFGKHLRDENGQFFSRNDARWLSPEERPFADQKVMLLPKEVSGVEVREENGMIKASPLPNWDPFMSLVITYLDQTCKTC